MHELQAHYEALRSRDGVAEIEAAGDPFASDAVRRRFVAIDGVETATAALDRPTLVCMGVGMTGPPHLGTVGQLLTGIELQAAGLDVQFVLADLEPYHGGGDAREIRRLAERYRSFALELGFDPEAGALRTQSEATDVMATGHRLARDYRPDSWEDGTTSSDTVWESAVETLYEAERGAEAGDATDGDTTRAAALHSAVLHGADFLHPLLEQGYEQVVISVGADEHELVPWTRRFRDAAGVSGCVAGAYTRMLPGFDGVPKQSKSVDVGVSLAAEPATIRERIASAPDPTDPERSTAFQSMCLASRDGADRLASLASACEVGGSEWTAARQRYADDIADLAERWQATGQ